jgi:8-oxo-dGTP pyrophosphatase MutT (NUDIX family)
MSDLLHQTSQALLTALAGHQPQCLEYPGSRPAAVLMPLWERDQRVQVVFTKRNATLPHHPGQISFPGGAVDPEDADLAETALRETCEEIGVCQGLVEVVGRLDQVLTITNFLVTPYLGLVDPRADFRPNPVEVERLVVVPLAKVLDREAYQPRPLQWEGMTLTQVALTQGQDVIWGATARMLLNLLDALGDKARDVARVAGNGAQKAVDSRRGLV